MNDDERYIWRTCPCSTPTVWTGYALASTLLLSWPSLPTAFLAFVVPLILKTASSFLLTSVYTPKPLFFWMSLWDLFHKWDFSILAFMPDIKNPLPPLLKVTRLPDYTVKGLLWAQIPPSLSCSSTIAHSQPARTHCPLSAIAHSQPARTSPQPDPLFLPHT